MTMAVQTTQHWDKWWWADWRADEGLRASTLAARGLWAEMLGLMAHAEPRGMLLLNGRPIALARLAQLAGCGARTCAKLLKELEDNGVFSRTAEGVIYSRRMRREADLRGEARRPDTPPALRAEEATAKPLRPFRRDDAPVKARRVFEAHGGCCGGCGTALRWDAAYGEDGYAGFGVRVPLAEGGTNADANLYPICAACAPARPGEARKPAGRTDSDTADGLSETPVGSLSELPVGMPVGILPHAGTRDGHVMRAGGGRADQAQKTDIYPETSSIPTGDGSDRANPTGDPPSGAAAGLGGQVLLDRLGELLIELSFELGLAEIDFDIAPIAQCVRAGACWGEVERGVRAGCRKIRQRPIRRWAAFAAFVEQEMRLAVRNRRGRAR